MPDLVSAKEYGKMHGVSHVAVLKWIDAGKLGPIGDAMVKEGKSWRIDVQKADAYLRDLARETNQSRLFAAPAAATPAGSPEASLPSGPRAKSSSTMGLDTYQGATAWKAKYEALLAQHKYEIESGKFILADEVKAEWFARTRTARDTLLTIPDRIAPILAAESDETAVRKLLFEEIHQALEELAQ